LRWFAPRAVESPGFPYGCRCASSGETAANDCKLEPDEDVVDQTKDEHGRLVARSAPDARDPNGNEPAFGSYRTYEGQKHCYDIDVGGVATPVCAVDA
jgi:hypothetical protein